jgi:predicted ArsR family transcriptional regulator
MEENSRCPFFKEGMNPMAIHKEYRKRVLELLLKSDEPMSSAKVAEKCGISLPTAYKILATLALEGKLKYTQVGVAKVYQINIPALTELGSRPEKVKLEEVE